MTTLKKILSWKVTLSVVIITLWAGSTSADEKTAICHYSEDENVWIHLLVGEKAAIAHLNQHDDAVPGGHTTESGTALDEECALAVVCPCNFDVSTATEENWGGSVYYVTRPGVPTGYGCLAEWYGDEYAEISVDSQNENCYLEISAAGVSVFNSIEGSASAEAIQCASDLDDYMQALVDNGVVIDRDLVNGEDVDCQVGVASNP